MTITGFSEPQWGIQLHPSVSSFGTADDQFQHASDAGATIVRFDVPWAWTEGTEGVDNWTVFETAMSRADAFGFRAIIQAGFAPPWANGGNPNDKIGPNVAHVDDYAAWVRRLASRCHVNYPGTCVAIEYWNEPDIGFLINPATSLQGDPLYYKSLAVAAYESVRGISPAGSDAAPEIEFWGGATASVGETSWDTWDWLDALIADGAPDWFDAWSNHPYYWDDNLTGAQMTSTVTESYWSRTFWIAGNNLKDKLAGWGYTGYMYGSEWGCPTDTPSGGSVPRGTPEVNQADMFQLGWPLWITQPRAGHLIVYVIRDIDSFETATTQDHFGIYRSDWVAKPIVSEMFDLPNGGTDGGGGGGGGNGVSSVAINNRFGLGF